MKFLTTFSRILVGLLFIFSGIIKSNDPKGTGIKLNEYFDVFASSFQVAQDTVTIEVKDNFDVNDKYSFTLAPGDSFINMQLNQAEPGKILFEDEVDSSFGSNVYVVKNGEEMFSYFYTLEDTIVLPKIQLKVTVSGASSKTVMDRSITINADSKHEVEEQINVSAFAKPESMWVGFFRGLKPYSLSFSIIMCILEVIFGFAILIGWQPKIMTWLILAMIVFFTFLTWYSAYYNKVTDCGCFGDFIKLKPWHSFLKDLVLLFFILIIFFRRHQIKPLFSSLFSINAVIVVTLASSVFAIYCNMFLPAWDFLPYKAGNNIREMMTAPKGARTVDSFVNVLVYQKGNQYDSLVFPKMPADTTWKYVTRLDRLVAPAWKSPIHEFDFTPRDEMDINLKDTLLNSKGYHILIVSAHLEKSHSSSWAKIKELAAKAKAMGVGVYAVTSSSLEEADMFASEQQLPFRFGSADETLLKTIVRSNPGIMLWHNGTIIDKWSCRSVPSADKIQKMMKK